MGEKWKIVTACCSQYSISVFLNLVINRRRAHFCSMTKSELWLQVVFFLIFTADCQTVNCHQLHVKLLPRHSSVTLPISHCWTWAGTRTCGIQGWRWFVRDWRIQTADYKFLGQLWLCTTNFHQCTTQSYEKSFSCAAKPLIIFQIWHHLHIANICVCLREYYKSCLREYYKNGLFN